MENRTDSDAIVTAAPAGSAMASRLWQPVPIVFISNACVMIIELVAGRIIAPYVGVSLYTWTSVIGVVLAGISLGNYIGGRLADRWASLRMLGIVFLLGGLSSLGVLAVDWLGSNALTNPSIVVNILIITAALFFLPAAILGMVSPIVAKLAVRDLTRTGTTLGRIYAAGTVGSIVGTFATGFVLIAWLGTHTIIWIVALVLMFLGFLLILNGRWQAMVALLVVFAGASLVAAEREWLQGPCLRETNYFCIKVRAEEQAGEDVRVLILDRLVHSYSSLTNPLRLIYGYEQVYAEMVSYRAEHGGGVDSLFIGGGGYTFPRYMEALFPKADIDVIEIDPGVTQVAYDELGLRRDTRIVSYNEDARLFLEREPTRAYDFVWGDAFNDFSVPYHLTTKEFNDRVRAWLKPDGFYVINMIDGPRRPFLRAFVHTLQQTFAHVYIVPTFHGWRDSPRTTFVLIASDVLLNRHFFDPVEDRVYLMSELLLSDQVVAELMAEDRPVLLTDRYAPVDQMLASVVRDETD